MLLLLLLLLPPHYSYSPLLLLLLLLPPHYSYSPLLLRQALLLLCKEQQKSAWVYCCCGKAFFEKMEYSRAADAFERCRRVSGARGVGAACMRACMRACLPALHCNMCNIV